LIVEVADASECDVSDGVITVTYPIGENYEYSLNGGVYTSNPIFQNLSPGNYVMQYKEIKSACISPSYNVDVNSLVCDIDPYVLCKLYQGLRGIITTDYSFLLVMSDRLAQVMFELNLSHYMLSQLMDNISSIDINLQYITDDNPDISVVDVNVYNSDMYPNISSFNINNWSYEISNVTTEGFNGSYKLFITMNDGSVLECPEFDLRLEEEGIEEEEPEEIDGLPLLYCGDSLDELNDSPNLLQDANIGDVFYIKEFPILLTTIQNNGSGLFSGVGIVPLPFGSKYLLVQFDNAKVGDNYKILDGTVRGISGAPVACTAPAIEFGGDICIPPPPPPSYSGPGGTDIDGYDPFGFDPETGLHKNGTNYDDNGFDINGNYQDTEPPSPYNPAGCNREGVDIDGNSCDPTPILSGVSTFINENGEQFESVLISILESIRNDYQFKLQGLNCQLFRNQINLALANPALGDYSEIVKGQLNEYFESGLSSNFASPLVLSDYDDNRKTVEIEMIESNHQKLYDCDLKSIRYNKIIDRINSILNDENQLNQLLAEITKRMARWNAEELDRYGDVSSNSFINWMTEVVKEIIVELENDPALFSFNFHRHKTQDKKKPYRIKKVNNEVPYVDYYNSMASISDVFGDNISMDEKEEIAFYLENGFKTIKGIDRVHYLEAMSQFTSSNGGGYPNLMPIKLSSTVASMMYTIYLDAFEFTNTSAKFDACIKIEDQESGKSLVFRAENIVFGPGGTSEPFRLSLANDKVSLRINNSAKLHLYSEFTFVEFDCNGFHRAGIKADVEFCPEFILPLDEGGNVIPDSNYVLQIPEVTMSNWMEFTFVMDAAPFALTNYENIHWSLDKMVIDTDSKNAASINGSPINITPPIGFESPIDVNSPNWKGFYVESLTVKFMSEIESDQEIKIDVNNLIIDGTGVSAYASAEMNILENGNLGGWPFSINNVSLLVLHNNISGFGFGGDLNLPIFDEKLGYTAEVYSGGVYKFAVELTDNLTCPLFFANATIKDDSNISVIMDSTGIVATATLNGELMMGGDLIPSLSGALPKVTFTRMQISTKAPYFNIGSWKVAGDGVNLDFSGFKVGIGLPSGYKPDGDLTNGVLLPISLELEGNYRIFASGTFGILGTMEVNSHGHHKWKYYKTEINQFCIGGSFPGVKSIAGCLTYFSDHNVYGSGFQANVQVEFDKFLDKIDAVGLFARHNSGYKYFFVDATASLQKSIPLGAISLNGFCGGVSYHMASNFDSNSLNFSDDFDMNNIVIGVSPSGIVYEPNNEIGLGLRAGATFVLTSLPSLSNGSILINMSFHAGGGLKEFAMKGTAKFLEIPSELLPFVELKDEKPSIPGVLIANVDLKINDTGIFGHFECYLDAGFIKGTMTEDGKLVDAVVRFTSSEWYIWMGQPEPLNLRAGLEMNFGPLSTTVQSYFCMGSKIPNFPDIPIELRRRIPNFASASSLRGGGGGLVFGASFTVRAHVDAFIASATATAAGGFDVMLRDYSSMRCADRPDENIGINGWYAAGQAWAMVSGTLRVFGINILSASIAAAFQARLPNPTFVQAAVSLEVCVIRCFDVSMDISIGELCEVQSIDPNNPLGIEVISSIVPFDDTQDMALETHPQIFLNVPIQDGIKIKDVAGNEKSYNIRMKELSLYSRSFEMNIPITNSFNRDMTIMTVVPSYLLPKGDTLDLSVIVDIFENGVLLQTEEKAVTFYTTNTLPTFANNVSLSYPLEGMNYFYKDEVYEEFITLKQTLYDYIKGTEANLKIQICEKGSANGVNVPLTVSEFGRRISFDISPYLENLREYDLKVFEVEESLKEESQSLRELLKISFKTSTFSTFREKVESFEQQNPNTPFFTHKVVFTSESFDDIEISKNLVRFGLETEGISSDYLRKLEGFTNYTDNCVKSILGLQKLPGCFHCAPAYTSINQDAIFYNVNYVNDFKLNVRRFIDPHISKIINHESDCWQSYEWIGSIYEFYLTTSPNFRDRNQSGTRAPEPPGIMMYYHTPDSRRVSAQKL
jgi:hypothetical protein